MVESRGGRLLSVWEAILLNQMFFDLMKVRLYEEGIYTRCAENINVGIDLVPVVVGDFGPQGLDVRLDATHLDCRYYVAGAFPTVPTPFQS